VKRLAAALDTEGGVRLLWWLIGLSLLVGFFAFLAVGANHPKDPVLEPRQTVAEFSTIGFTVEHGAATDTFCALLADTDARRATGMMGRRDLSGYDGMVFAWPQPVDTTQVFFYNRKVPVALSVAWFDTAGKFISTADMEPCGDVDNCPRVRATGSYKFALEVLKGGLGHLGVAPGSVLNVQQTGC
jgi:uncharacterized membrane protein (UPF0127 family)